MLNALRIAGKSLRLRFENAQGRREVAEALGKLGNARAVKPLLRLLREETASVRRAAAEALGHLGDRRAIKPVVDLLGDKSASVRRTAAAALGDLGDKCAVGPLLSVIEDVDPAVRRGVAKALGRIGDAQVVNHLLRLLNDGDPSVRRAATEALGEFQDARAIDGLGRLLTDELEEVRFSAAASLSQLGNPHGVEFLVDKLGADDWVERRMAAEALGRARQPFALEGLRGSLVDDDEDVRRAAAEALANLGEMEWRDCVEGDSEDFNRVAQALEARACATGAPSEMDLLRRARAATERAEDFECVLCGSRSSLRGRFVSCGSIVERSRIEGGRHTTYDTHEDIRVWRLWLCRSCAPKGLAASIEKKGSEATNLMLLSAAAVFVGLISLMLIVTGEVGRHPHGYSGILILVLAGGILIGLLGLVGIIVGLVWRLGLRVSAYKASQALEVTKEHLRDAFEGAAEYVLRARTGINDTTGAEVFGTYDLPEFSERTASDDEEDAYPGVVPRRVILRVARTALEAVPPGWRPVHRKKLASEQPQG